jgi:hypothetical protein
MLCQYKMKSKALLQEHRYTIYKQVYTITYLTTKVFNVIIQAEYSVRV